MITRPRAAFPFVVIIVDEVAFLTAYHPDKALRERIKADLATLTTQGRAVGYCVVAALQDPRKEVMSIRNLFPDRIAMRLDEPEQVDMVLGDGATGPRRRRGADLLRPGDRGGGGVRPAGIRPRPGTGPRRLGHRHRHPRHGRAVRRARGRGGGRDETRCARHPTWRTDDPCPVCGTGLHATDDGAVAAVTQDCPLCGWSATWQPPADGR